MVGTCDSDTLLPHNFEAEQSVLGALLADSTATWPLIATLLKPEHFHEGLHARILRRLPALQAPARS